VIVRVWFRKGGADDGLWWSAEIDGVEWACASVEFAAPCSTGWEDLADRPRAEQRHFIQTTAAGFRWDGHRLVLTGADSGAING
jgi:hypothetical protein